MNWRGIHHLYFGWFLSVVGVVWTFINFVKHGLDPCFWSLGLIIFGAIWALDDAIKEKWGFFWWLPFSAVDRWMKRHIPPYFAVCYELDQIVKRKK